MLKKLFGARSASRPVPHAISPGQRVYAIGDIHGRCDLLDRLLAQIDADDAARPAAETILIFLGDLVDRGADSAGVVERLRLLAAERPSTRFLTGNHEELFLSALACDEKALRLFCRVGGRETAISYGMTPEEYEGYDYDEFGRRLIELVPDDHRTFLASFEDMGVIGDYAFVHAGIRPDVPLADQSPTDLRWIRSTFLDHRQPFEKMIVHGHTIVDQVDMRSNRIGIDTGAYTSDRLTALGLDGNERWTLQT